jgi:Icc-related predicted phosphoesterase
MPITFGPYLEELQLMSFVRVATVGDLHCTKTSQGAFQPLFTVIRDAADLLLIAGDLTDYGLPEEAQILARELSALRMPVVAVLGNHDRESGKEADVSRILTEAGVVMLDGDACEIKGVGVAGVTGFGGGFGKHALAPWGEPVIKQFVHAAVEEALKLEKALARLRTQSLIALMHYSPVQQTVAGEPLEIYPFLGSSRLEEPIGRYPVAYVFHGHAHRGQPEGHTASGAAVYNVSLPLLTRLFPDRPPFRVFNVAVAETPRRDIPTADPVLPSVPANAAVAVAAGSVAGRS